MRNLVSVVVLLATTSMSFGQVVANSGYHLAYAVATEDLNRIAPYDRYGAVYFWLGDVDKDARPTFIKSFAGHLNSLSRETTPVPVYVVSKDLTVLRVNFRDMLWPEKVVAKLVDVDPYYLHRVEIKELYPGGYWTDGKHYPAGAFNVHKYVPVLPARFFVWLTSIQEGRDPGYYDFLEIKDRNDFHKVVGFNEKVFEDAKRNEQLDVALRSGISQQPRRVGIFPSLEGRVYITFDSKEAVREKNPLRVLDRKTFKHDAEEAFGFLPNGFLAWMLNKADGERQNSAPDFIGYNKLSISNDGRIHINLACLHCHYSKGMKGSNGLIDFKPLFRSSVDTAPLASYDYDKLEEFRRKYTKEIARDILLDKMRHAYAVKEATDMEADVWAKSVVDIYADYDDGATMQEASTYLGCTEKELRASLLHYAFKTKKLDPTFLIWLRAEPDKIPRLQYHEIFPELVKTFYYERGYDAKVSADPAAARELLADLPKGRGASMLPKK